MNLVFDAKKAVFAMTYHVIDEGLASWVDETSADAAYNRLLWIDFEATIKRWDWRMMRNWQRLRWVQNKTRTGIDVVEGVAYFAAL